MFDYGADTVPDHAVALLLALPRRVVAYTNRLRIPYRRVDPFIGPDSMRTAGTTPLSLGELLRRADAISLRAPLTEANGHLIDDGRPAELKAGAVVVNTSREGLIDEGALADAVHAG